MEMKIRCLFTDSLMSIIYTYCERNDIFSVPCLKVSKDRPSYNRPPTKFREGNVFTRVSLSVHTHGNPTCPSSFPHPALTMPSQHPGHQTWDPPYTPVPAPVPQPATSGVITGDLFKLVFEDPPAVTIEPHKVSESR